MPIYEYNCRDCKQIFEDWQKDYEERELPCPVCGGPATRLISSTSFVLKGGGWYSSGYSADGAGSPESKPAQPTAAEPGAAPGGVSEAAAPQGGGGEAPSGGESKPCAGAACTPAAS